FLFPAYDKSCACMAQENIKEMNILHWNDFHARNVPYKTTRKKDGVVTEYMVGGSASMLGYLKKFRDDKSLVLHGGDDYQGSPISSITKGYSQVSLLNLFDIDAFVVGNHEFDYGAVTLDSALMNANFNVLSGNIYIPSQNRTFGKSYIVKIINGIKTGVIGISPVELKSLTLPVNVEMVEVLNTDSVISAGISALKKEDCDLIVLLSHNGADEDSVFASKFNDLDVIIGGHSHTPIFKPRTVNGVLICQAGSYGKFLGKLDLKVDTDKDTIVYSFGKLNETVLDSVVYDKRAGDMVDLMLASIEPEMKRVIGKLEVDWKKDNCSQWTVDAMRSTLSTDLAFLNAGSIRKDMMKGDITVGDIWEINPFGNNIMTFKASGKIIKEMMVNNLTAATKNEELSYYDMIIFSGMTLKVSGQKLKNGETDFITEILVNGEPFDEGKTYTAATNSYTASQYKKYFGELSEEIKADDTNIIDRDLLLEAVQQQKVINNVYEKRVIIE
ncbi:MAG: bifunctional metallophosphatase/5'-nucleotidase, partial [Ignavibacteria bacterium]|nr:bifunctional metallophosphatase/5'-nucleotidase [Ignavibacteria bacterium]